MTAGKRPAAKAGLTAGKRQTAKAGLTAGEGAAAKAGLAAEKKPELKAPGAGKQGLRGRRFMLRMKAAAAKAIAGSWPKARNPFQLYYADMLRGKDCGNSKDAADKWKNMDVASRKKWVDEAVREKQRQLMAKDSAGVKPRLTVAVRRARSMSSHSSVTVAAESPSICKANTVQAGSWELQWHNPSATHAVAGSGGFGAAYRGVCRRSGVQGAVKIFKPDEEDRQECAHEVSIYAIIEKADTRRLFLHVLEAGLTAPIPFLRFLGQVFRCPRS